MINPIVLLNELTTMSRTWQPSASYENLYRRAQILRSIRNFFANRDVMEVETPLLCHTSVTDPFIQSIPALVQLHSQQQHYYLQTSPEYAMKRLLAAGYGAIYQITKAFRQGEVGRLHNPEFTMLEWYRPGFDHHDLMDEMDELLQLILNTSSAERKTYSELFQSYLQIDPHQVSTENLVACVKANNLSVSEDANFDCDTWLNLLMTHCIEPHLGNDRPCFIYDFPASQAALARIQQGVASRFEVYFKGLELANGFYELQDAHEQRQRFEKNLVLRKQLELVELPIDEFFLAALEHGLPDCAGVALGIDRLVMLALQHDEIGDVLSFKFSLV